MTDKFLSRDRVAETCERLRSEGLSIGFTSGAFDLMHAGHADFLERARGRCDVLVVGVNRDDSVRQYKGPGRPVVGEADRAQLVAALGSVDYVFLFSERRNARNLEILKPDYYIKAGDYAKSELTSASVIEKLGGEAILLPIETPTSTTDLIRRACGSVGAEVGGGEGKGSQSAPEEAVSLDLAPTKASPAAFFDRDGTINREVEYLHEPEKFELLEGAGEGMRRFADMGYRIVVVTTQAGIGLGYFTKEDFYRVNQAMFRALKPFGVKIDRIYFCPHGAGEGCECRKPATALLERARRDLNLDLSQSVLIGDKTTDLEAARRLGMTKILVKTGHGGRDGEIDLTPDYQAENLADAAQWVLSRERGK